MSPAVCRKNSECKNYGKITKLKDIGVSSSYHLGTVTDSNTVFSAD